MFACLPRASVKSQDLTCSVPWFMTRAIEGNAMVSLRREVADPVVSRWVQSPQPMHVVDWVFPGGDALQPVYPSSYDGLIFFQQTTPTQLTANALKNVATPSGVVWTF